MPDAQLSGHRILGRLGGGGMGEVFLAEDLRLRRRVALKLLTERASDNAEARARFLREARHAASLQHPNICTVFQVGEVEAEVVLDLDPPRVIHAGTPYLSMEFLEGHTLAEIIAADAPLDAERILDYTRQLAEGLAEAHRLGLAHRDLKPQNVLVTDRGLLKILDFGLAKSAAPVSTAETTLPVSAADLTTPGLVLGTPAYMSPEQAAGEAVDQRSDVFSFGLIVSEMATGRRVFEAPTITLLLAKVIGSAPPPLTREDLPPSLLTACNRCLRREAGERFSNAGEIVRALRGDGEPFPTATTAYAGPDRAVSARRRARRWVRPLLVAAVPAAAAIAALLLMDRGGSPEAGPTLAVLPIRNLGPEDQAYVAQGLTEELTSRLTSLRDLRVVSATSARQYAGSERSTREIARDLGTRYVLEGSLQWSADMEQARVTCRLVDAGADRALWTRAIPARRDSLFFLQPLIAEEVARELDVRILAPVRAALRRPPTRSGEAYDAFLRGADAASRAYDERSARAAAAMFARAVELDPQSAVARARLSMSHSWMYWAGFDVSGERIATARAEADKAFVLDPALPEARLALGYCLYRGERRYEEALREFEQVLETLPNDSEVLFAAAAVQRRRGDLESARRRFEQAAALDPRSPAKWWEAGETLRFMRRFAEADRAYDRCLGIDPAFAPAWVSKVESRLLGEGDPARAKSVLKDAAAHAPSDPDLAWVATVCAIFDEDYRGAMGSLDAGRFGHPAPVLLFRTWILRLTGQRDAALAAADSLRAVMEYEVERSPEDPDGHSLLGLALAALGQKSPAVDAGEAAVRLAAGDAVLESEMRFQLAWIHWWLGSREEAFAELTGLLGRPSWVTAARLARDPTFRDARGDPAFARLLATGAGARS